MGDILRASRPFSWINTALPFLAMAWAVHRSLTPAIVLGTLYFLAPYNLLLYGVNDIFDYASDRLNPRKGGAIEGGLVGPSLAGRLWLAVAVSNIPFLLILGRLAGGMAAAALAVTVLVALAYSMPPLRTKVIAFLDSATSSLHFVLPAVCGGLIAGASLSSLPWRLLAAFFLWGMASHALGAIQDVGYDREAGIGSIAVALGARTTAWFSLAAYSAAVLLVASWGGAALVAAVALLPYVLLAASCLAGDIEMQARRAWHSFLGLNLLTGFIITQVLLRVWGAGPVTVPQMLAWGSAVGVLAILAMTIANELAMRQRAPAPARRPSVSIIVPVRNEIGTIGICLAAIRSQRYEGEWETIVVDDGSEDGTAEAAKTLLRPRDRLLRPGPAPESWTGKCWAAQQGAEAAQGEILIFLDADTTLQPLALHALVREIAGSGGLLSVLTRYQMLSWSERLFMPAFAQLQLCFLPIALMNAGRPVLPYANGPCMAVPREEYLASGGHAAIRGSSREDVDLARSISAAGLPVRLARGADIATTRHYRTLDGISGFWRRTYYAYGGNSLAVALFGILGMGTVFLLPLALLPVALVMGDRSALVGSLIGLAGLLLLRSLIAVRERQPLSTILLHPVTWLGTLIFQALSTMDGLRGETPRWRGRPLPVEMTR
jgi:4-hydroxybenzoate polyprenyltransferase/GT2 family glycosyltransferase